MHLFTQSAVLKALGWSLFNSLWQMGLLWLAYALLVAIFRKASADMRHFLALLLIFTGTAWFAASFISGVISADEHAGYPFPAGIPRQFIGQLLPYCSFLYLLALVFLLARYFSHYLHSRRLRSMGLSRIQPELRVFVSETSRLMGIGKEVRVWLSSLVEGPVTLGFLKPVILIPFATVNNLSLQQVEAILLHELAHIKRYDYLLNLCVTILEVIFFFNPFTLRLIRNIKREREHRCDDLVMQFRYDPHIYVSALLSLATDGQRRQQMALAATGKNDRLLLHRVRRILKQKSKADRPGARPVVFLLFAIFAGIIGLSRPENSFVRMMQGKGRDLVRTAGPAESPTIRIMRNSLPPKAKAPASPIDGQPKKPHVTPYPSDEQDTPQDLILASNKSSDNDDEDPGYQQTAELKEADPSTSSEARAYSISEAPVNINITSVAPAPDQDLPYVPSSSFSMGHTEDGAYRWQQQASAADKAARTEIERGLKVLQTEKITLGKLRLAMSLSIRPTTRKVVVSEKRPDIQNLQQQLGEEQLRLKEEYLLKQHELLKKLQKARKVKVIIYI